MHIDSSNVLAEPDSWEVATSTGELSKIDWVVMTQMGLRGDKEVGVTNLAN